MLCLSQIVIIIRIELFENEYIYFYTIGVSLSDLEPLQQASLHPAQHDFMHPAQNSCPCGM